MVRSAVHFLMIAVAASFSWAGTLEDWSNLRPGENIGTYADGNGSKIEFGPGKGPAEGQKSLSITSNLVSGGFCGVWHPLSGDLSKAQALRFQVKGSAKGTVQLALEDAHHVQYIVKFEAQPGEWKEVTLSFTSFVQHPFYTPAGADLGHPMDLTQVNSLNLQPEVAGPFTLQVGPIEGVELPIPTGTVLPWPSSKKDAGSPGSGPKVDPDQPKVLARAIRLDQVGYLPSQPKLAFLTLPGRSGNEFQVLQLPGKKTVLKGKLGDPTHDPDSGDTLRSMDFSSLTVPGTYVLRVPGLVESHPFRVDQDTYTDAFYLSMRSYYGQRCGVAVDLSPRYPKYHYAACHTKDGDLHVSSGNKGHIAALKGWHDAGDYGKYSVNSGIATGTLLLAYDWYKDRIGKVRLDLPESGNGLPDILNEVKWNLDWMFAMQDGDGGVWHKLTTEKFCGFVMPKEDTDTRFIIGTGKAPYKNSTATGDFSAVMALAARVYRPFLPDYSKRCGEAAEKAWKWLSANPSVSFSNPSGVVTGGYGDGHAGDEALWASAELFALTGKKEYGDYFSAHYEKYVPSDKDPQAWPTVANLGWWSYLFNDRKEKDPKVQEDLKSKYLTAARGIVAASKGVGYRHSLRANNYIWGSNAVAGNFGMMLLAAERLSPGEGFFPTALENLHYLLGRNTFDLCFVTGLGTHSPKHPHHRPSGADGIEEPWPGLLVGGPNRSPQDPAMRRLKACPPAASYMDDQESYASNEVAINWNAPLVFLLASTLSVNE